MSYSFFGTCFNDYTQLFDCLRSISNQTIIPKEIILVNSGDTNIEKEIINKFNSKKIKIVYIHEKLTRVKSLNLALSKSSSKYSFRFDTRSRFTPEYAEKALDILENKELNASVVGGVPNIVSSINKYEANLCAEIMKRSYIYFYPKHRDVNYSGYSSSIYLGCFSTPILKKIKFNEKEALLSEDSLIINDFLDKGFKAYISSTIKVSYVCRSSFKNILKLFNTYGYCRANTILISKKLFISKRHFLVSFALIIFSIFLLKISIAYLFFIPFSLLIFNFCNEILFYKKSFNFFVPIYGTLCQISWILGFSWSLISIFKNKELKSNFIN
mgnify:CR=1 FL=1|tara:strand:- start:92 stop:1075 length:984 start_codon:yes stop_codon:yes gene_type:complete